MRYELSLVRDSVTVDQSQPVAPLRKELREATDALIHEALLVNDLPELLRLSADTVLCTARILARLGRDPEVPDFVEGAQALIEQGRAVADRGLQLNSPETLLCGAVMLELACRGVFAALGAPYDQVLAEVDRAARVGEAPQVRPLLIASGLIKEDEAANDR